MNTAKQIAELLKCVREISPLIHNITNYVTVNDCANIELAVGASPIMTDEIEEIDDIVGISNVVVLNMGTLNKRTIQSMLAAGKAANLKGIPVIFDPVGAGASALRNTTASQILSEVRVSVLRGNLSEISFCAGEKVNTKGVDSSSLDEGNDAEAVALRAAKRYGCTVAVTGKIDVVTDGKRIITIHNGDALLPAITGSGCMTSCLVGAFAGVTDDMVLASAAGILTMCLAGELARANSRGLGAFHSGLFDGVGALDEATIISRAKVYEKSC